jgi:hemoglobin
MKTPFEELGGEEVARAIAAAFYRQMDDTQPALAKVHRLDEAGKVHPEARERVALFFIGWLGGPTTYMDRYGHPRLRMRHAHVRIDEAMRDAWLAAMQLALNEVGVTGNIRAYLDARFADVADFLRNAE